MPPDRPRCVCCGGLVIQGYCIHGPCPRYRKKQRQWSWPVEYAYLLEHAGVVLIPSIAMVELFADIEDYLSFYNEL
jgi:hypothetical protein